MNNIIRKILNIIRKILGRPHQVHAAATMRFSGSVGIEVRRVHTGRTFLGGDGENGEEYDWVVSIRHLAQSCESWRFTAQERERIAGAFASVPECDQEHWFRGRRGTGIGGWEDMGPPPRERAGENRYSTRDAPALYLSDSMAGVGRELPDESLPLHGQKFRIPIPTIRIADVSSPRAPNLLRILFDFAEGDNIAERQGWNNFRFSQALADIARSLNLDGLAVPGVRGDSNTRYLNLVLFSPSKWKEWSTREDGYRIVTPGSR